jgi:hypothetical protein
MQPTKNKEREDNLYPGPKKRAKTLIEQAQEQEHSIKKIQQQAETFPWPFLQAIHDLNEEEEREEDPLCHAVAITEIPKDTNYQSLVALCEDLKPIESLSFISPPEEIAVLAFHSAEQAQQAHKRLRSAEFALLETTTFHESDIAPSSLHIGWLQGTPSHESIRLQLAKEKITPRSIVTRKERTKVTFWNQKDLILSSNVGINPLSYSSSLFVSFLGGVPFNCKESSIYAALKQADITPFRIHIPKDKTTNLPKGCAFITFQDAKTYLKALETPLILKYRRDLAWLRCTKKKQK